MINSLSRKLHFLRQNLNGIWSTLVVTIFTRLTGLKLIGCKFFGIPTWNLHPGSEVKIGKRCIFRSSQRSNLIGINHPCMISTFSRDARLKIGDNCGFSGTVIGAFTSIEIGDNVRCGANTVISDGDWHQGDPRVGDPVPVVIGNNVWLGLNAVVLKGARIGDNSIIGAGSIVAGEIPPNVIAAGNPCRPIKDLG